MKSLRHLISAACMLAFAFDGHAAGKPNILFIAVDDLRVEMACYGSSIAITPSLDALAKVGLRLNRAYCQQAICRPSRASVMTGARPDTTGLTHNYVALRDLRPNIVTLPQHFIANGYETVYHGKIFHHGWHLGDMGIWGKATNYEIATRVPLIIWSPDMPERSRGKATDALVELIDIYPTLCDLAGIDQPDHLEGHSFAPLLTDPERKWKTAAFSQYPNPALREWAANPLSPGMRETFFGPLIREVEARIIAQQKERWDRRLFENDLMGYAMRTDRYRLVVWEDLAHPEAKPVFVELYDHNRDPAETLNIAQREPEQVDGLMARFDSGWKGSLPESTNQR